MNADLPTFEPWGQSVLTLRYMAISPKGYLAPWPASRMKRVWMRLRGWQFVEDSAIESQRKLNWLRTCSYMAPTEAVSLADLEQRYPTPTLQEVGQMLRVEIERQRREGGPFDDTSVLLDELGR